MTDLKTEDLIVLAYASNNCCTTVLDVDEVSKQKHIWKPETFVVDLEKKVWSYLDWKDVKIGNSRRLYSGFNQECREGIIGIYDRRNTKDLNSMVHASKEFTRISGSVLDD